MRNASVLAGLFGVAILCFVLAGHLAGPLSPLAPSRADAVATSDVPAGVRFVMVALGGFRGLLADALWIRTARLQEEGRVFEVAELTSWITRLEPRSPEVWIYHAWNLSYNIAALFADPMDRWRWVESGIRLLRDEGIPANPRESRLYRELGWIYADKVAGRWDPAQLQYRIGLAGEVTGLMGGGAFEADRAQRMPEMSGKLVGSGLLPDILARADADYGPLDWRLPESHALYWGLRGRPFQRPDQHWCDRLIWSAMIETVRGGALVFDPARRLYVRGPRVDVALKGVRRCERDGVFAAPLTLAVGDQFVREALLWLYAFGRTEEAAEALKVLRRVPDSNVGDEAIGTVISRELESRLQGIDKPSAHALVQGMLTRGFLWTALGQAEVGAGCERMARLHWDAMRSIWKDSPSDVDEGTWMELRRRGLDEARRQLPVEVARPATGGG